MARLAGPVPDPATKRAGIPPELAAITRKALALEPDDRWPTAASFAAALEAFLSGAPIEGLGAIGGATVVGGAAAIAATARPNPAAVPYAPDAYAGRPPIEARTGRPCARPVPTDARRRLAMTTRRSRARARCSGSPA